MVTPRASDFRDYFLVNCMGNPLETLVAATRMIFSGLFEEHPGFKLVLLHGGGCLPFYSSRADHTREVRPETRARIPDHSPSHYMKKLFYDTMVFQALYLRHLVEVVGVDHVMLGTDFPFDTSEPDPLAFSRLISDNEGAAISGGNAASFYGHD